MYKKITLYTLKKCNFNSPIIPQQSWKVHIQNEHLYRKEPGIKSVALNILCSIQILWCFLRKPHNNHFRADEELRAHMHSESPVVSDSLWPHGLYPSRLLCPWDSPGQNTGMGCHALLQGSSWSRGRTHISCIGRRIFYRWATWKAAKAWKV